MASLLFYFHNFAQVDPGKVDSLSRLIDSSAHAYRVQQDSFIKLQDSTYKSETGKTLQRNLDNFLIEQKRREQRERRQTYVRIVLSVLILLVGAIALMRRRKSKP